MGDVAVREQQPEAGAVTAHSIRVKSLPVFDAKDVARFWRTAGAGDPAACWIWSGEKQPRRGNYGRFYAKGKRYRAHRISYYLANGSLPDGLLICHRCDNPPCCNPGHLFADTQQANIDDCIRKGRFPTTRVWHGLNKGERNGNARFTPDLIRMIRAEPCDKRGDAIALARRLGMTQSTISNIRLRKSWKHVL